MVDDCIRTENPVLPLDSFEQPTNGSRERRLLAALPAHPMLPVIQVFALWLSVCYSSLVLSLIISTRAA
jgi:hypothetical protein